MKSHGRTAALFAAAAFVTLGLGTALRAADPVHDRHEAMEEVGQAFKPLVSIAKKQTPFDAALVQKSAATMAEHLKAAADMFPAGSGGGRAKPEIWTDAAGFEKNMKEAHAAIDALTKVKDEAEFGTAFPAVGTSCKTCHDKYRSARK